MADRQEPSSIPAGTRLFVVQAHWDPEANVWWAESADVPGLVAEADTFEAMREDLRSLVPELLRENLGIKAGGISFQIVSDRIENVSVA